MTNKLGFSVQCVLIASTAVLFTGCGGGGDGDGGSGGGNLSPNVRITATNADDVAESANNGPDNIAATDKVSGVFRSVNNSGTGLPSVKDVVGYALSQVEANGGSNNVLRQTRAAESFPCEDGGTMGVSGTELNGTIAFNNCADEFGTINGSISFSSSGSGDLDSYINDYQETVSINFNDVTVSVTEGQQTVTMTMNGDMQFEESYTSSTDTYVGRDTSSSFIFSIGSESFGFQNLVLNWTETFTMETWNISGVLSTPIGVVSYETLEDFEEVYTDLAHRAGKAKITGDSSSMILTVVDTTNVTLEVDEDGDGQIDETLNVTPADVGL